MSKPLTRRAASAAFAEGNNPRTACALNFRGDVAYSYDEPIAVRVGTILYVTTAKFSMTTSHHRGQVAGAFAIAHGSDRVIDTPHREIRQHAISRRQGAGPVGARYDAPDPKRPMVSDGHGFFMRDPRLPAVAS